MRYRFIGDTLLTVPFLRNLRLAEPDAYIAWMVAPGSSDAVQGIPYADELIYWDPVTIHADSRGTHRTLGAKIRFIRDLRTRRFDCVYVLKRSLSSALIALLTGAKERIGFATEGRSFLLTKAVPYRHDQHEVQNFLDVLRSEGVAIQDDRLELWPTAAEERKAAELIAAAGAGTGPFVLIHPFSAVVERGWPLESFGDLADRLSRELGCRIAVAGGPRDREAFAAVRSLFPPAALDLVGTCSLRETAAVLRRAALFIGNDSGIMHLAAAAGTPLVALFGPQSPVKFGPWSRKARVLYAGMPCSPCRQKFFTQCRPSDRNRPECMERLSVSDVYAACQAQLVSDGASS